MKKLDNIIDQFLMKLYKKQGNHLSEIMMNWSKIVGPVFANNTRPSKIKSQFYKGQKINILYIQVTDSSKAIEISYSESLIIERIAVYLGKKIIQRMRVQVLSFEGVDDSVNNL